MIKAQEGGAVTQDLTLDAQIASCVRRLQYILDVHGDEGAAAMQRAIIASLERLRRIEAAAPAEPV